MNNSCYGKTLESKRNRIHVQLIRSIDEAQRVTDKSLMQSFKIFDENLAAVTLKQTKIYWNKPTIVGACVLEFAKFHMFSFHYKVMKNVFDCQLIYSDTDSLLYEINHVDLYKELAENANLRKNFDFSNYPQNQPLYHNGNKMVTLLFKDEMAGKILEEFVGLKPKMYSIKYGDNEKLAAKGVSRFAQRNFKHDIYKTVLSTTNSIRTNNIRIGSTLHQLETISSSKISLSAFDDKRYILENGIETLPFGHYLVRDIVAFREISADPDWGEEIVASPDWETLVSKYGPSQFDNRSNRTLPRPNTPPRARDSHNDTLSEILNDIWTPPDPGFHQEEYNESDLDDDWLVDLATDMRKHATDFYATYGQEISTSFRNPYIDDEAVEEVTSEPEEVPQRKRRHDVILSSGEEFWYFHNEVS